jgi:hypothetical protein
MKLRLLRAGILGALVLVVTLSPVGAGAATPSSDTVGPGDTTASWTGPDVDAETAGPEECDLTTGILFDPFCDDFMLSVTAVGEVAVSIQGKVPANDFDLYVYDNTGRVVGSSALPGGIEATTFCAHPNLDPYLVRTVYFTTVDTPVPPDAVGYTGEATWTADDGSCSAAPAQALHQGTLEFGPATIVSAHFLGSEPQTTLERELPGFRSATNPSRIFVDWPLALNIGQLSRSLDSGDSFRLLYDSACADLSRPNCATSGGGDTENEVNLHTGTVLFSDQEVVTNEAFAASFDHGDSFISQTPLSNPTTATDRQWLTATDATYQVAVLPAGMGTVEGFLTYHVPCAGQYIQAIARAGTTSAPVAQPVPQPILQVVNVGQSGQPRVDNNRNSPGYRWIYQPFHSCIGGLGTPPAGSLMVATAYGPNFANPLAWKSNFVDVTTPDIFSWSAIDSAGNAYVVWTSDGVLYLSASPINHPRNNPNSGGWPGTFWTPKVQVAAPGLGSTVFPQVIAGDPGRIGISYDGTSMCTGLPDACPDNTEWHTYGAVITNALSQAGPPVVATGRVSHRVVHKGNICTSGAGCSEPLDRSLLDMVDIGFDQVGRLGVVFSDNRTDSFHERGPGREDESPFVHFAKQSSGRSVLANRTVNVPVPAGPCRTDRTRDAFWPNRAGVSTPVPLPGGRNLPALDETRACLTVEGGNVVARITVDEASAAAMNRDLGAYNTQSQPCVGLACDAQRLQFVVRFLTGTEIYHLSMEHTAGGSRRFFAGKLDTNDKIRLFITGPPVGVGAVVAAAYHTDATFPATGTVEGNTIVIRSPAANFGLAVGSQVFSVTGFALAGPTEANEKSSAEIMRTVDASPPFDARLASSTGGGGGGGGGDDDHDDDGDDDDGDDDEGDGDHHPEDDEDDDEDD